MKDFGTSPVCDPTSVHITKVLLQSGLTAGGVAVFVSMRTPTTCALSMTPGVMILDSTGRLISFGDVSLKRTSGLTANVDNQIVGEWRDVCTPVSMPIRARLLLQNHLITGPSSTTTAPTCFVNGAPSPPDAAPPSGSLNLVLGLG